MSVNYKLDIDIDGLTDLKKVIGFFVERGYGLITSYLEDGKKLQFAFEDAVQFLAKGNCIFLKQEPETSGIQLCHSKKSKYAELVHDRITLMFSDRLLDWPRAEELYKDGLDRAGIKQMVKDFVEMMKQLSNVKGLKEGLDYGSGFTYVLGEKKE